MLSSIPPRSLWSPARLSAADLQALLEGAATLKQAMRRPDGWQPLRGRHLALLCSGPGPNADAYAQAVTELGGTVALLPAWRSRAGDSVPAAARLLGRLYDAVDACDLPAEVVEQLELHASVPVLNGLARADHPLHALADLMTMREAGGKPLPALRLRIEGAADAPAQRAADALARKAGIEVVAPAVVLATAGADDAPPPSCDFVLDPTTPAASGRLTVPGAQAPERERLAALLADNRRYALQAMLVGVLG